MRRRVVIGKIGKQTVAALFSCLGSFILLGSFACGGSKKGAAGLRAQE